MADDATSYPGSIDTFGAATTGISRSVAPKESDRFNKLQTAMVAVQTKLNASQPLDSDLTAIAALSTTSYGRAFLALADAAAGRTALGLGTASTTASSAYEVAGAAAAAQAASQPLDSDLTSIAALTTTAFGRGSLTQADAASFRTYIGAGTGGSGGSADTVVGNRQTGTAYTAVQGDAGKEIEMSSSSPNAVTFPTGITAGSVGSVLQYGTGTTTLVLGSGLTAIGTPNLVIGVQGGAVGWRYVSTTEIELSSELVGPSAQSVAYSATITPNADITDVLNIGALTGALSLANPTGSPVDGQNLLIRFTQDGTGGRLVTHGTAYTFDTSTPALGDPIAASSKWERLYRYESSTAKWRCVGLWGAIDYGTSVAYAATITPNSDTTDYLTIAALTGNLTLAAPTGTPVNGQKLMIDFTQDATGSRTITYNAAYAFGTDVTSALDPSAANSKWMRLFQWHAGTNKWRATAIVRGF